MITSTGSGTAPAAHDTSVASRLRPADLEHRQPADVPAGPFCIPQAVTRSSLPGAPGTMLTALMVVYPAFATVAVIALGILLGSSGA